MLVVHTAFRREFRLAPALVRGVEDSDTARSAVVADHLTWLLQMLHHHHEGEDRLLLPLLLTRVPEDLAPIVHTMESQHAGISQGIDDVGGGLPAWRESADPSLRDALADRLESVHIRLVEHLALEERELLPIAATAMSQQEWDRLGEEGMGSLDKKDVPLVLGSFMYEGDPAVIRTMLSHAPFVPRLLMPRIGPLTFRRYSRRVHGTPTP